MAITTLGNTSKLPRFTPLWRYMKLSTLLLLSDGRAFFPSVKTLQAGDPLEGTQHYDAYWLFSMFQHFHGEKNLKELEQWLTNDCDSNQVYNFNESGAFGAIYRYQVLAEEFVKRVGARRAVWCWIRNDDESAAMWSIYANAGVAIKSDWESLQQSLPANRRFQAALIRYAASDGSSLLCYRQY